MKKVILFWFYKEIDVCIDRLELIKKYNPELEIFGLYGGEHKNENIYKNTLGKYFNDFYTLESKDSNRKWRNGDLSLQEWYYNRGKNLEWDSIYIVQWDILIFDSLEKIFNDYKSNQVYFSGTTTLSKNIETKWSRTSTDIERPKYLTFKKYIENTNGYTDRLLCCLPMFEILPKIFFEKYGKLNNLELGFIEYRKPTYTKILGLDFYQKDMGVLRFQDKSIWPMNAACIEIKEKYINNELSKKDGRRMFHPYYKKWNN